MDTPAIPLLTPMQYLCLFLTNLLGFLVAKKVLKLDMSLQNPGIVWFITTVGSILQWCNQHVMGVTLIDQWNGITYEMFVLMASHVLPGSICLVALGLGSRGVKVMTLILMTSIKTCLGTWNLPYFEAQFVSSLLQTYDDAVYEYICMVLCIVIVLTVSSKPKAYYDVMEMTYSLAFEWYYMGYFLYVSMMVLYFATEYYLRTISKRTVLEVISINTAGALLRFMPMMLSFDEFKVVQSWDHNGRSESERTGFLAMLRDKVHTEFRNTVLEAKSMLTMAAEPQGCTNYRADNGIPFIQMHGNETSCYVLRFSFNKMAERIVCGYPVLFQLAKGDVLSIISVGPFCLLMSIFAPTCHTMIGTRTRHCVKFLLGVALSAVMHVGIVLCWVEIDVNSTEKTETFQMLMNATRVHSKESTPAADGIGASIATTIAGSLFVLLSMG